MRTAFQTTVIARLFMLFAAALLALSAGAARANNMDTRLVVEAAAAPGETVTIAIAQVPAKGWHGYWSNPGDAGYGMSLDWTLPAGFSAGQPEYPVPQPLVIGSLMNHVYEGPFAVLVPITVPDSATPGETVSIAVEARWLVCTDKICVPEQGRFEAELTIAKGADRPAPDPQFAQWRTALPSPVAEQGRYELVGGKLRMAIPVAKGAGLFEPHLFPVDDGVISYIAPQSFAQDGDWLIVEMDAADGFEPGAPINAVLRMDGDGRGLAVTLASGEVPTGGIPLAGSGDGNVADSLGWLIFAAFLGGIILNVMPCVFPILSLKALSLARANSGGAKVEALAYTAGVMLAVLALGAVLLALRAAGQEVGWAFQLQEPATVVILLVLAAAITANLAGLFEMTLPVGVSGHHGGAFLTGLLAAFAATPCTGPFMAAAMGAALLLPVLDAMVLFGALGLGLAFPFLAIGFVPLLRKGLPKPGKWMVHFRHAMAVPMGLTALALGWLAWRVGGEMLLVLALAATLIVIVLLAFAGRKQRRGGRAMAPALAAIAVALAAGGASAALDRPEPIVEEGALDAQPFSEAALAEARASGKPVFAYFTADWCVTCKVNEAAAIDREATRAAFDKAGVIVLRGDWTRRDPAITRFLQSQGAAGVPLYVWYAPGANGEVLPQILSVDMLGKLASSVASGTQ
ncbi:protein-disulfide reductase DsbD family protein [Croceicoccus naphthovorans]|uniref:Thiol:disulfide interchange protein n=1 Tax=Croceicoccus naphthovorans TaxID=1348774 RepID=A0A0G3XFB1_9SPHN|nr:thioredoxin family protein [Croceicoccus naphthovorans]AKM09336.1 thiol:disulfide interchange protein [Croceicoccus naphthovorans]MBB3990247.1 DsbC/DsbD-like thiol-disulfide interchange protein/cytochrome c biogenesis protein CcdA [Croceicoccus naphthovorans]